MKTPAPLAWGRGEIGRTMLVVVILALGALEAGAQGNVYNVFAWFNFDDGRLATQAIPLGRNPGNRVFITPYGEVPSPPRGFRDTWTADQNGAFGLRLLTARGSIAEEYLIGMASNIILERHRLGTRGRALFQADFYIPPSPYAIPSLAVLAMDPIPPGQNMPTSYYRFGITTAREVYFSHVIAGAAVAADYQFNRDFLGKIPRGSWHRFAIVVEGQTTIRCYVDGNEAPFSPIQNDSLKRMQVGVMLADGANEYSAWVDNLSIQWTNEDVPLPDSPWVHTWTGTAPVRLTSTAPPDTGVGTGGATPVATPGSTAPSEGPVVWYDVDSGWRQSQAQQKPMLVYFLAPRLQATRQLDQIIETSPSAQAFLGRHVCVKMDVNQLRGGDYAQKFNIFKVPTLIIFNMQGQEQGRAVYNRNDTWALLEAKFTRQ